MNDFEVILREVHLIIISIDSILQANSNFSVKQNCNSNIELFSDV